MIEIKNLNINYEKDFFIVFETNLSFSAPTLLLGDESFSSAVFRSTIGIDKPKSGEIFIDGKNVKIIKSKDFPISYLPKQPVTFENKTAKENIEYSLKVRKFSKEKIKNELNSLETSFNLKFLSEKVKSLTNSKKIITAFLRAIIRKPKYILVENFFSSIDQNDLDLAKEIFNYALNSSIIIASEKDENFVKFYKDFNIVEVENGSVKT